MEFLAQVSALTQHATPSGSSPVEAAGFIGLCYAILEVVKAGIQKIPGLGRSNKCAWQGGAAIKASDVLLAVDEDGKPRVFVPRSLERNQAEMLKLQRETAQVLRQAASTLDRIAERSCPLARDVRP